MRGRGLERGGSPVAPGHDASRFGLKDAAPEDSWGRREV